MNNKITIRSILFGSLMAVLLCGINSFLTLKFGIMEEGPTIAALFFFAAFFMSKKVITTGEMVVVATMGSAGGSLGFMTNFFAAQVMIGNPFSFWEMVSFTFATSIVGLVVVMVLRQILIVQDEKLPEDQRLPWVPARAVESLIKTLVETMDRMQPVYLFGFLALGTLYVIANDSGLGYVPEVLPISMFGLAAFGAAIAFAPLTIGAGYMMGLRTCVGFGVGSVILIIMAPHVAPYTGNLAKPHLYLWPGIGFLVGNGIMGLIVRWEIIVDSIKSLFRIETGGDDTPIMSGKTFAIFSVLGLGGAATCLYFQFHLTILIIVAMMVIGGLLLNIIATRAAAQTCFNPARVMGVILQGVCAVLGGASASTNLAGAGFVAGSGAQAGNLTGDMAYGRWFKFLPSRQFWLQTGVLIPSVFASAWAFDMINTNFELTLEGGDLAAPIGKMWAIAAMVFDPSKGGDSLPAFALESMLATGLIAAIWTYLEENETFRKFAPSAMGVGLAMILPIYYDLAFFAGGIMMWVVFHGIFKVREMTLTTVAVALIVAEGLGGITQGVLNTFGLLGG